MAGFYDFEMTSITGETVPFSRFEGTACLVVNVASECGLTPQYAGLRALHHETDGLVVLGFPCNQFGAQEPGTDDDICEFATAKFDVDFPMFSKIEVNGEGAAPLYAWLRTEAPGDGPTADITWNFEKFLVDRSGEVVARFAPMTTPEEIRDRLPDLL